MSDPAPRRNLLWALVGALVLAGVLVALLVTTARTQGRLAVIRACRSCTVAGKPVEPGWVEVQPGDAWSIPLGAHAGMVVRGPARFEVAGSERVALSNGAAVLVAGPGGRPAVLLPRNESAGIEGATVAAEGAGARVEVATSIGGNRVAVHAGRATVAATTGERKLAAGEGWQTGSPPPLMQLAPDEGAWLAKLAAKP